MRMKLLIFMFLAACAGNSQSKTTDVTPVTPSDNEAKPAAKAEAPKVLPSFTLASVDGETFSSTELTGKPTIVNFWHPQ